MSTLTPDSPPYRHPQDGRWLTECLFYETYKNHRTPEQTPRLCFQDDDIIKKGNHIISIKKIYLEMKDPTEYTFAKKVFGSWTHWKKLCNCSPLKEYILAMREELDLLLKAEGIQLLREHAKSQPSAAKYLAEGTYNKKPVGRPKKEDKTDFGKDILREYEQDLARMKAVPNAQYEDTSADD